MLKYLKSLLGGKEREARVFSPDEIPAWIGERERGVSEQLAADAAEPVRAIRNAFAQLRHIANTLKDAEEDPEIHPKYRSVAQKSLPLFLRAMNSSLARELPEETEEFYTAAVENLKGCVNAVRGQGRYLNVVFPESMKEVRTGIDAIGREINSLTAALGTAQKERARIATVRAACEALDGMRHDMKKSADKEHRINSRLEEISGRLAAISGELETLARDESAASVAEVRKAASEREQAREELMRKYVALSMTTSHVFRKAEKVAGRKNAAAEANLLKRGMKVLSDHEIAPGAEIGSAMESAFPIAGRMVDEGEIVLKNREEKQMFADTAAFCRELTETCTRLHETTAECQAQELALASHPVIARTQSLTRERAQLESMREREERARQELLEWRRKAEADLPLLKEELAKKMGELLGESVQISGETSS